MVIVDDRGVIRLVNAQTEALFGYRRDELLGRPVEVLLPDRFRAHHPQHRSGYTVTRRTRPMGSGLDLYGLRRNGTEFPVEISLSPLETAEGLLVSAAIRDVSDRKAAEARISELAALVESSQDAIITHTLDGRITYWNAAAHRLYGYSPEVAVGRHIGTLAPPDLKDEVTALLARPARGERVENHESPGSPPPAGCSTSTSLSGRPGTSTGRSAAPPRSSATWRTASAPSWSSPGCTSSSGTSRSPCSAA